MRFVLPLCLSFSLTLIATSGLSSPPGKEAARKSFKTGQLYFKVDQFNAALEKFQEAYKLQPHPDIIFMIGQCYRNLGESTKAINCFKIYLKEKPDAEDRAQVEHLIDELSQKQLAIQPAVIEPIDQEENPALPQKNSETKLSSPVVAEKTLTPPPRSQPSAPVAQSKPFYKRWWFWTIIGGVVVTGAGVGLGIGLSSSHSSAPSGSLGTVDLR